MLSITLLDGRTLSGRSWSEVESRFAAAGMNQLATDFRSECASRALLWSGTADLRIDGSSRDFVFECKRAGLIAQVRNIRAAFAAVNTKKVEYVA